MQIRTDRIKTFDEVVYRTPITTCYSVIAKDCAQKEQSKFAVLIKCAFCPCAFTQ